MNLTNRANVKIWLNIDTPDSDALIDRLIGAASNLITNYLGRGQLARTTYNEVQSGRGTNRIILGRWPVVAVSALAVNGNTINASTTPGGYGFALQAANGSSLCGKPQMLGVSGGGDTFGGFNDNGWGTQQSLPGGVAGRAFAQGNSNIAITYEAGYCIQAEAHVVTSGGTHTASPTCPSGPFAQDDGVTYQNGTALVKVGSAPGSGQYTVTIDADSGVATYGFNAADAGAIVLISYSFTPSDLEDACISLVGERVRYMNRIGQVSVSAAGTTTTSFSQKDMPDYIKTALLPYKKAFPSYA